MGDKITYRLACAADANQLAELCWQLQTDDRDVVDVAKRDGFIAAFTDAFCGDALQDYHHWVAESGQRLIGVMSVKTVRQLPRPDRLEGCWGYLTNCYVLPDYRNRGIGTQLLERVSAWSKEQDFELLVVWPSERGYSFYRRAGFDRYADPLVLKLHSDI